MCLMVKAAETAMNQDAALSRILGNADVQGLVESWASMTKSKIPSDRSMQNRD